MNCFLVLVYLYYVHTYFYCRTSERFSEPGFACVSHGGVSVLVIPPDVVLVLVMLVQKE